MSLESIKARLSEVKPYKPSPYVDQLAAKLGINPRNVLKLDANENLFLLKNFIQKVMVEASYASDSRLYPETEGDELRFQLAKLNGVDPDQIIIASGGDQIIEVLYDSLVKRGGRVTAVTPTFSMYARAANQRQLEYIEAPLNSDFTLNVQGVLGKAEGSDLLVLCNPNNPTGNEFNKDEILQLIDGFDGFVLIDEAYMDFGNYSLVQETDYRKNLLILRTFSKAYGLAGLRLGYCMTNVELAEIINGQCMMPYPVSSPVLRVGTILLRNQEKIDGLVETAKEERERLIDELNTIDGVTAFPSATNFVLLNTEKPYSEVYEGLQDRGILIRAFGKVLDKDNCLRVTVAPRPMMDRFIEALREITK